MTPVERRASASLAMIYAAVSPDVQGGEYIGPTGYMNYKGPLGNKPSSDESYDQEAARRLWQISEELTNTHYPFTESTAINA